MYRLLLGIFYFLYAVVLCFLWLWKFVKEEKRAFLLFSVILANRAMVYAMAMTLKSPVFTVPFSSMGLVLFFSYIIFVYAKVSEAAGCDHKNLVIIFYMTCGVSSLMESVAATNVLLDLGIHFSILVVLMLVIVAKEFIAVFCLLSIYKICCKMSSKSLNLLILSAFLMVVQIVILPLIPFVGTLFGFFYLYFQLFFMHFSLRLLYSVSVDTEKVSNALRFEDYFTESIKEEGQV